MTLTSKDAKLIIGMLARGDKQHDVAAYFGENQARIVEATEGKYGTTEAAPKEELPPRGAPGPKGRKLRAFVRKATDAIEAGNPTEALKYLHEGAANWDKNEV